MTTSPEDVAAPADDTLVFRTSRARIFAFTIIGFLVVWPAGNLMASWWLGDDTADPWWSVLLQAALTGTAVAALSPFIAPGRPQTWIRTSSGGLELSSAGGDPILLAWDDISHIQVRRSFCCGGYWR